MELVTLLSVLTQVRQWLEYIKPKHSDRDNKSDEALVKFDQALEALYTAINETKIYIASIEKKAMAGLEPGTSVETEAELSRLWTKAALRMS